MKRLPFILIVFILLCFWGCKNRLNAVKSADTLDSDTSEISIDLAMEIDPATDTLAEYRDTLIGKFNGSDIDTLIAEPIEMRDERGLRL